MFILKWIDNNMKKYSKYIAYGLISIIVLSPLLSMADTTPYRYQHGFGANLTGNGNTTSPESPNPNDEYYTVATDWGDFGEPYDCGDYLPAENTVPEGVWFYQKSNSCKSDQERTVTTYKKEDGNLTPVPYGDPVIERQTVTITGTRGATGTKTEFSIYISGPEFASPYDAYLNWQSNGVATYKLKASAEGSGVPTSFTEFGTESFLDLSSLNPKPGTYTFTVLGTKESGETAEAEIKVEIVDFSIKSFTMAETKANPGQYLHLSWEAPNDAKLTLSGYGDVTGLSSIVVQAPSRIGANFWTLTAYKSINGYDIYSRVEINYQIVAP